MRADSDAASPPTGRRWQYMLTGAPLDAEAFSLREHGDHRHPRQVRQATSLVARAVAATLRTRFDFSLSGELPPSGCVLVSRHDSYWDGVLAVALDPRVVPITSGRWRSIPAVGWVLDSYGVLWTDDLTIARATGLVRRGATCWIAPRGYERGDSDGPPHLGAATICVGAAAPLVPMAITGLNRTGRARRLRSVAVVAIGPPVWPTAGESAAAFSSRLEATLSRSTY